MGLKKAGTSGLYVPGFAPAETVTLYRCIVTDSSVIVKARGLEAAPGLGVEVERRSMTHIDIDAGIKSHI